MIGYRNAVYLPQEECIKIFSWDKQGNRVSFTSSYNPYIMLEDRTGNDVSIFNTKLRKKTFKTQYERYKFLKECGTRRVFENLNPVQQFLVDTYYKYNETEEFQQHPIRTMFLDIEVYSPDVFPKADLAQHPINVITIHDSIEQKFYSWGLARYKNTNADVVYKYCISEKQLLMEFINYFEANAPDLLTGWNSAGFDIPYIINRITNVLGAEYIKQLSPVQRVYCRTLRSGMFGKEEIRWYIDGISCVDYIDIYKRFSFVNRESYKLDFIAELELGEKKIDYGNTNLASLSKENWQLFVDYNIQDVNLLVRMDAKLQFVELLRMLSYMGLTTMENAMSTLSTITGTACIKARLRQQFLPTFIRSGSDEKNPGAYVAEPLEGFQKDVVSFDANSLYPNIMISLNMSPETKIGKVIDKDESNVTVQHCSGSTFKLSHAKFAQFVKDEQVAISRAKVLFTQKHKGILPEIVDHYYQERVKIRKEMQGLKKGGKTDKDTKDKIVQLNAKQLCIKIFINSVYGYMGNKNAPIGDDDIAASITLTGQSVIKAARTYGRDFAQSIIGNNDFEDIAVAGDTDSAYFSISPMLRASNIKLIENGKVTAEAHAIIEKFNDYLNDRIKVWMKDALNSHDPRIEFKREAIIDRGLFLEKKRYVAHVVDDEGIECDKWKYVGVDVVRTTMPKAIKPYVKKIIETMMVSQNRKATNDVVNEAYQIFKGLKPEELAYTSGMSDYTKYASKSKDMNMPKGTPVHVRSAHGYNTLIKKLNIDNKYEMLQSGDKVRWMYVKHPNKYNLQSIAFKYYYPQELAEAFEPDYEKMFEKIVFSVVERFYAAVKWSAHKPNEQVKSDLLDLFA